MPRGCSHAALGLVNAIGSGGLGAAAALDLELCVDVREAPGYGGKLAGPEGPVEVEGRLLRAVAEAASSRLGLRLSGLRVEGRTSVPVAAGLKGSSALVNAVLEALARLAGVELSLYELALLGVDASRRAGLTVTGALDDHLAVSGCGAFATVNPSRVARWEPEVPGVAVLCLRGRRDIRGVDPSAYRPYASLFRRAWRLAVQGMWWEAATLNGLAMMLAHGDPVGAALVALHEAGVEPLAVGVSGKGPTLYAVLGSPPEAARAAEALSGSLGCRTLVARLLSC